MVLERRVGAFANTQRDQSWCCFEDTWRCGAHTVRGTYLYIQSPVYIPHATNLEFNAVRACSRLRKELPRRVPKRLPSASRPPSTTSWRAESIGSARVTKHSDVGIFPLHKKNEFIDDWRFSHGAQAKPAQKPASYLSRISAELNPPGPSRRAGWRAAAADSCSETLAFQ